MSKIIDLDKNKKFCILPWIHFHVMPNANVYPCCISDHQTPFANLKDDTFDGVWNKESFRQLRLNMLNNLPSKSCEQCYMQEESSTFSMRNSMNSKFSKDLELATKTQEDGSIEDPQMKYIDIRYSNGCNFKCRGCGHGLSSAWYDDTIELYGPNPDLRALLRLRNIVPSFWNDFLKVLPQAEQIYFGGGEPLFMEDHYLVLDFLVENKKTDIVIFYNTNLSVFGKNNPRLFSLWQQFKIIVVEVSLDDIGVRAEYYRHGTDWNRMTENLDLLISAGPNIGLSVNWTVSCFNVFYLPEIINFLIHRKYIDLDCFHVNILLSPEYYSVQILPEIFKELIKSRLHKLQLMIQMFHPPEKAAGFNKQISNLIKHMFAKNVSHLIPEFQQITKKLDLIRNESFTKTYPELKVLHYD